MDKLYDYRNCQSLFGYAAQVHARSGGICQLCGCGAGNGANFDLWRQFTVEHLIGEQQGGYPPAIRSAVGQRFSTLTAAEQGKLVAQIDALNTVSACSFCNSTTSRNRHTTRLDTLILETTGGPDEVLAAVQQEAAAVLARKRAEVAWKLESVRRAFENQILPALAQARTTQLSDSSTSHADPPEG